MTIVLFRNCVIRTLESSHPSVCIKLKGLSGMGSGMKAQLVHTVPCLHGLRNVAFGVQSPGFCKQSSQGTEEAGSASFRFLLRETDTSACL